MAKIIRIGEDEFEEVEEEPKKDHDCKEGDDIIEDSEGADLLVEEDPPPLSITLPFFIIAVVLCVIVFCLIYFGVTK